MNMWKEGSRSVVRCGREMTAQELEAAIETVRLCSGLGRVELAETICEHWGWITASGTHKVTACLNVLEELERKGELHLPAKQRRGGIARARGAEEGKEESSTGIARPSESRRSGCAIVSEHFES